MILYFVRHGETDWNVKKKIQGKTDVPLNETGKQQAKELADMLLDRKKEGTLQVVRAYTSPQLRAAQTAQEARALFAREQLRLPLSFDEDGSALALCGAAQAPATYFIDEEGFIAARSEGGIGEDALLFGLSLLSAGAARTPGADATAAPQAQP